MQIMDVTDKNGIRYFPAALYWADDLELKSPIQEVAGVYAALNNQGKILIIAERMDAGGQHIGVFKGALYKEDIQSIIPALYPSEHVNLELVMSLSEAAEKWGLADGASVRKALERRKFRPSEAKRSGAIWFVTYPGMQRVFGPIKSVKPTYSIARDELYAQFFRIWQLECKAAAIELTLPEINTRKTIFNQIITTLEEAYRCLKDGGKVLLKTYPNSGDAKVIQIMDSPQSLLEWIANLNNFGMNTTKTKEAILYKLKEI